MSTYSKVHSSQAALDSHLAKIKKRGGTYSVQRMTIYYSFPDKKEKPKSNKKEKPKRFDTKAKRIARIKIGAILTFKKPLNWKGEKFGQILVADIEKQKGAIKLIGYTRDTPWYDSMDELLEVIDWKWMEDNVIDNTQNY